jgi:DNA primase
MMTDAKALKERVDCRILIATELGDPVQRSGSAWQWRCPFHPDGRTPSLTAWPDGWHCFGCGAHGDAIAWLMKRRNLTFLEAVEALGGADPLPTRSQAQVTRSTPLPLREPPSIAWRQDALGAVETLHLHLLAPEGARAREYLHKRGIADEDIRLWKLGYVPADRLARWGDVEVRLPRGIAIPALVGGVPWYVKIRRPAGDPKYVHVKGGRSALYGYDHLQGRPALLLCEGEFDAILMHRLVGDVLDVATFGSASESDIRLWLPVLVQYGRIWLGFDNDTAGERARQWWYGRTRRAHGLIVPVGKDWTEAWLELGDEGLREYVLECVSVEVEHGQEIGGLAGDVRAVHHQCG